MALTLDLPDPQIIVNFPDDANGLFWHHRLLIHKVGGGRWVALTPDMEQEDINLGDMQYIVLERRREFPAPQAPYVYAFDDVTAADLRQAKRLAVLRATLLDDEDPQEAGDFGWVIFDAQHARFGERLTAGEVQDATLARARGVAVLDGEEVFVELVDMGELKAWRDQRRQAEGDLRLLGNHRAADGTRVLQLRDAVPLMKQSDFEDWRLPGPRAAREWLAAVRDSAGDLLTYHQEWVRRSGVAESSAVTHVHFVLCEVMRLAHSVDQVDISNLQCLELVARRIIQDETAVSRNPRHPDYGGLDVIMSAPVAALGQARTLRFDAWVTEELKTQANIHKQTRLWQEEQRALIAKRDNRDDPKRKKDKKQEKGDAPGAGGAGQGQ